jgi:hypothetical protein
MKWNVEKVCVGAGGDEGLVRHFATNVHKFSRKEKWIDSANLITK